jgi:hypothetical protein
MGIRHSVNSKSNPHPSFCLGKREARSAGGSGLLNCKHPATVLTAEVKLIGYFNPEPRTKKAS